MTGTSIKMGTNGFVSLSFSKAMVCMLQIKVIMLLVNNIMKLFNHILIKVLITLLILMEVKELITYFM